MIARAKRSGRRRDHLRLVEPAAPSGLPPVLTDPKARKEFEQLTQALLDAVIEIIDLADGDPDIEPNAEECEGGDDFEDTDGV